MSNPVVRAATPADLDEAGRLLAVAFMPDPVSRWIFPDPAERARLHPAFFRPFLEAVLDGGALHVAGDTVGAALWLPVDGHGPAEDDDGLALRLEAAIGPEHTKRFAVLDDLMSADHPTRPHSYLPFIAVHPDHQGTGVGRALLEHHLRLLDAEGTPAYLEASTPRSISLYARHGFRRTAGTLDLPEGPSLYPMWRDPA
ncbi:GNAT family N-acetyltransferase [Micromonospora sp. NPDC000207]|uniref:GNAT family N-acetyltransferase n=1 Tax=Micromonospora sp. NPDC000207 TaxID=3154246 RepID=UPI0033197881